MPKPKTIIIIAASALVIITIVIIIFGTRPARPTETTLTMWGFEDPATLSTIFTRLKTDQKINIAYTQKQRQNFDQTMLEALANGTSPDIYQLNHQQLTQYQNKLVAAPSSIFTLQNYQSRFADVIYSEMVNQKGIWGAPIFLDTLALFYNKDMFNSMAIPQPPNTWDAFKQDSIILTQKDSRDNILRAGSAWGTGKNVNYAKDLISALMIQSGTKMTSQDNRQATFNQAVISNGQSYNTGQKAVEFYTSFADVQKETYSWNRRMANSLNTFSQAKSAMTFGYSSDYYWLKKQAPYLNFGVAAFPQVSQADLMVNYGDFDIFVVSNRSGKYISAWQALEYLTQPDNLKTYLTSAKRPTPARDLVNWQKQDLELGIFAQQALSARSWYQADPAQIDAIFVEMLDSVVLKEASIDEAVNRAAERTTQVLR